MCAFHHNLSLLSLLFLLPYCFRGWGKNIKGKVGCGFNFPGFDRTNKKGCQKKKPVFLKYRNEVNKERANENETKTPVAFIISVHKEFFIRLTPYKPTTPQR